MLFPGVAFSLTPRTPRSSQAKPAPSFSGSKRWSSLVSTPVADATPDVAFKAP